MKKLLIAALLLLSLGASQAVTAQVRINIDLNASGRNTPWYNSDDRYYYLPEQGVYYNVTRRQYVYRENGDWYYASRLPRRYKGFTYRQSRYVTVREKAPFMRHEQFESKYRNRGNENRGRGRNDRRR